jgi:hypothetical protein
LAVVHDGYFVDAFGLVVGALLEVLVDVLEVGDADLVIEFFRVYRLIENKLGGLRAKAIH